MVDPFLILSLAIAIAFAVLAIRTIVSWLRQPDRRHGNLAMAMSALAVMMLMAPLLGSAGPAAQVVTDMAAVVFLISGYGLLAFRDSFVPFRPRTMRAITFAIVAVGVLDIGLQLPASPDSPHSPVQTLALAATVGLWSFCILEPIVTFWVASLGRPAVEKARLRALSIGYAALLLVIITGTLAGSFNSGVRVAVDVVSLAIVPVLYVSFFPPAWLRRIWRQPEEDQFRYALHDLLLYSPDRAFDRRRRRLCDRLRRVGPGRAGNQPQGRPVPQRQGRVAEGWAFCGRSRPVALRIHTGYPSRPAAGARGDGDHHRALEPAVRR